MSRPYKNFLQLLLIPHHHHYHHQRSALPIPLSISSQVTLIYFPLPESNRFGHLRVGRRTEPEEKSASPHFKFQLNYLKYLVNFYPPVGEAWGYWIYRLCLCREVRPLPSTSVLDITLNYIRWWSSSSRSLGNVE